MRRPRAKTLGLAAVIAASATTAACGISSAATSNGLASGPSGTPITIGISLPLGGPAQAQGFAPDGQATLRGYRLWRDDVNSHGGLHGHPVKLVVLDDQGQPNETTANYLTLINQDHVDLTLAPFSSLLTKIAAKVTNSKGYALPAGSAGAPSVYALGYHTIFSTNVPVKVQMVPFANWVVGMKNASSLTAAYPMVNDPFADPPVQATMTTFKNAGIHTVYQVPGNPMSPNAGYNPAAKDSVLEGYARQVANQHPDIVVLGSVTPQTVDDFVKGFKQARFTPKIFICSAGPDQGAAFLNIVGNAAAEGFMVPNGWYGAYPNALSHVMVQNYIAQYGGTASDINADVAEAYSAGEVLAAGVQAVGVQANGSVNQGPMMNWLHSHEIQTVLGPVRFNTNGENLDALSQAVIFQWKPNASGAGAPQFVQVLGNVGTNQQPLFPKPGWGG